MTGNGLPSAVQPSSSALTFHATSDASQLESGERPNLPAEATTSRANTDGSLLGGFSQRTGPETTASPECGLPAFSPEGGIKDEQVEVTPQVSGKTCDAFSGKMTEPLSPGNASMKDLEGPQKHLNQEIKEVEESFAHETHPLPEEEQRSRAKTDMVDFKLAEEEVDVNFWAGPHEKGVPIASSSDWSPRPPTVDSVIHSRIVKATNRASPHAASRPGVRGQRVKPCSHPVSFCPANV